VQQHRRVLEHVEVLNVVPVRVGEHEQVDFVGSEAAARQRLPQQHAPPDVGGVDEDAPRLAVDVGAFDQEDAAEGGQALVGGEREAVQQHVNRGKARHRLAPARSRCPARTRHTVQSARAGVKPPSRRPRSVASTSAPSPVG
jgi:hypothetical protein